MPTLSAGAARMTPVNSGVLSAPRLDRPLHALRLAGAEGDRLMRTASQAISMCWVLALAWTRATLGELSLGQLTASAISYAGLAAVSLATYAHHLQHARASLASLHARDMARAATDLIHRLARIAAQPALPRFFPSDPALVATTAAMAMASLLHWRLRAPEVAAPLADRVNRVLRIRLLTLLTALRAWLADQIPAWMRLLAPTSLVRDIPSRRRPARPATSIFSPFSLPQRC